MLHSSNFTTISSILNWSTASAKNSQVLRDESEKKVKKNSTCAVKTLQLIYKLSWTIAGENVSIQNKILMHDPHILRLLYSILLFRSEQKLYNATSWKEILVSTLEMKGMVLQSRMKYCLNWKSISEVSISWHKLSRITFIIFE